MLGYMTEKEALLKGFTHHGSYYGISLWVLPNEAFVVAAKWGPLEYLMPITMAIEQIIVGILYPDQEPSFMFKTGKAIDDSL